ncbi:Octapeptide-repeat protein T2, partial [Ophiophagus hannah]
MLKVHTHLCACMRNPHAAHLCTRVCDPLHMHMSPTNASPPTHVWQIPNNQLAGGVTCACAVDLFRVMVRMPAEIALRATSDTCAIGLPSRVKKERKKEDRSPIFTARRLQGGFLGPRGVQWRLLEAFKGETKKGRKKEKERKRKKERGREGKGMEKERKGGKGERKEGRKEGGRKQERERKGGREGRKEERMKGREGRKKEREGGKAERGKGREKGGREGEREKGEEGRTTNPGTRCSFRECFETAQQSRAGRDFRGHLVQPLVSSRRHLGYFGASPSHMSTKPCPPSHMPPKPCPPMWMAEVSDSVDEREPVRESGKDLDEDPASDAGIGPGPSESGVLPSELLESGSSKAEDPGEPVPSVRVHRAAKRREQLKQKG